MGSERWKVPLNWIWVSASDIADVLSGGTPDTSDPENFSEDGISWLTPADLSNYYFTYINKGARSLSVKGFENSGANLLPKGTVLFTSRAPIGYCVIAAGEIATNQGFKNFVLIGEISPEFIRYYLLSSKEYAESLASGSTFKELSAKRAEKLRIPLPPLNEQKRIVDQIEKLRVNIQRAEEALGEARELEKTLVASYTTGWDEGLLGNHIQERIELAGEYWRKYPVAGLSNEGQITDRREPLSEKSAHRCKVIRPGDIVFNPIRFSIGSIARYRGTEPAIVSPEYQVFQTRDTMSAELLCRYLRSPEGRSRLEIETQGSVRYRVYLSNLKQLMMPIAPPEKQAEAEQFFLTLNKAFKSVEEALLLTPWLEQSILNKAFRGELVSQDPNDEPASVLLERIQAERKVLEKQKKESKKRNRA